MPCAKTQPVLPATADPEDCLGGAFSGAETLGGSAPKRNSTGLRSWHMGIEEDDHEFELSLCSVATSKPVYKTTTNLKSANRPSSYRVAYLKGK